MPSDIAPSLHGDELPPGGSNSTVAVDVEHLEKMLHRGTRLHFEVFCDEPERMGGEDSYPPPLTYIAFGVGF
jgi:hypothetical protein